MCKKCKSGFWKLKQLLKMQNYYGELEKIN
jgi:hypothetical protein